MSLNYYGSNSNYDTLTIDDLNKRRVDLSKYVPQFLYNEKTLNKIYKSQEELAAQAVVAQQTVHIHTAV